MHPLDSVKGTFSVKLAALTVLFIILSLLLSSAFFYYNMDKGLGETYAEKVRLFSVYKFEIIKQSIFIFSGFALLAFFGIAASGVLQTHKVVGPLVRTRIVARQMSEGKFDVSVKFREDDAIHQLADSLNQFARSYEGRYAVLHSGVREMYQDAQEMRELLQRGDSEGARAIRMKIAKRTKELNEVLSGIKV
jgi:signal transduction histidine kinase